jgi:hypothetical protein
MTEKRRTMKRRTAETRSNKKSEETRTESNRANDQSRGERERVASPVSVCDHLTAPRPDESVRYNIGADLGVVRLSGSRSRKALGSNSLAAWGVALQHFEPSSTTASERR